MGTPPQLTIREYAPEDAPALSRLRYDSVRTLGPRRYTPEQVDAWAPAPVEAPLVHARATDNRQTLVAVDGSGVILGYGDLERDGHIDNLYCSPAASGRGVAPRLLEALVARAAADGITRLHVEASEVARGLFERYGFAVVRRRDFEVRGVPIHNYAMERSLP